MLPTQLLQLFSKYKAGLVALPFHPRRCLITGSSSTSVLLLILDMQLNTLYRCECFHTRELFTLRNSLTPAVRLITKHWQPRHLAIYTGKHTHRKYKASRDTSSGNPTPAATLKPALQTDLWPLGGMEQSKGETLGVSQVTCATWIVFSHNHGGNTGCTQTPPQRTAGCRGTSDAH